MCRVLSYLGKPILAKELLYDPDNSFIKQSYHPRHMSHLLNLAGFGMVAWDKHSTNSEMPFIYKTTSLPFYDDNLRNISTKTAPNCLLMHLRGVPYNEKHVVSNQNVHPFKFPAEKIVLAHNGSLAHFEKIKFDLLEYVKPCYQINIKGTTDSEWIYALFLSQLTKTTGDIETNDIIHAVVETFSIIHRVRKKNNITITSPVNIFISNGDFIAATRYVLDYGWHSLSDQTAPHFTYHSLWYTYGEHYGVYDGEYRMDGNNKSSIIIASEPLTEDTTTWVEVPEYSIIVARKKNEEIEIVSSDIAI
jgi:glutamine amidotransferase